MIRRRTRETIRDYSESNLDSLEAYQVRFYAILDDDNINLYFNDTIMKTIKLNWE